MFLIMGISDKGGKLNFNQDVVCNCCGRYGSIEVYMIYTCFSLFFLPLIKWNRRYYVTMTCCHQSFELDPETGRAIEKGILTKINPELLHFHNSYNNNFNDGFKTCPRCGYGTSEDFEFCPKCGTRF